jgi:hypothetical protein
LGDPDAVRRILDSAGFADVTFDEVRASVYYGSDVDAAFEFVSGFAMVQETAARLDVGQRGARAGSPPPPVGRAPGGPMASGSTHAPGSWPRAAYDDRTFPHRDD